MQGCLNDKCETGNRCCYYCDDYKKCRKKCTSKANHALNCDRSFSYPVPDEKKYIGTLSARLTPDIVESLKTGWRKPNIENLTGAVNRLCLAASQKDAGQRKNNDPSKSVIWSSWEINLCQYAVLFEGVVLVLSGLLEGLEDCDADENITAIPSREPPSEYGFHSHLKRGGQSSNVELLTSTFEKLCNEESWESNDAHCYQEIIFFETVTLVLSGVLEKRNRECT